MNQHGCNNIHDRKREGTGITLKNSPPWSDISLHNPPVLCGSLGEMYSEVMTTVMRLINYLKASSALQHRTPRTFLTEVGATFDGLLLHSNNVRWLSKSTVVERFWAAEL